MLDEGQEADIVDAVLSPSESASSEAPAAAASTGPTRNAAAQIDLADSAVRLIALIEAESAQETEAAVTTEAETRREAEADAEAGGGLPGFYRWLMRTRQVGRRASQLLRAVQSLNGPPERKERLDDLVRLSLLLECNSAIGFNADGTLRNTEEAARVQTAADTEAAAEAEEIRQADAQLAQRMSPAERKPHGDDDRRLGPLRDDAEVLMAKEDLMGHRSGRGLLILTCAVLAVSLVVFMATDGDTEWYATWMLLVTATTASLMTGISIFVSAGRRRRPVEAYREMGKELQSNRIMISTIRSHS